jgi:hypothetical protein
MEIKKNKLKAEVVGMICDMCNKNCAKDAENPDYAYEHGTLSANWGYYSDGRDLTEEECHLCEECFSKVREFIRSNGGKVRVITVSAFRSTGPHFNKKPGVDYIVLDKSKSVPLSGPIDESQVF